MKRRELGNLEVSAIGYGCMGLDANYGPATDKDLRRHTMEIQRSGSRPSAKGPPPTTAMQHIAINEALDGKAVDWLEKVSDEEYDER
jgi:hypothetical protein